jgi:FkbM family methyltransferase
VGGNTKNYLRVGGVGLLICAMKVKITKTPALSRISWPGIKFPLFVRVPSSDVLIFQNIFIRRDYDFDVKRTPEIIVDAGANIGFASIYFANKFPDAKIIAIEPEESNLVILKKNIAPYKNIILVGKALWHENKTINLVDPGSGKWGFMTQAKGGVEEKFGKTVHEVQGATVDTIMKEQGIGHIDILKIDIEGAEREIFKDPSAWIEKADALIVELHERKKPGCSRSFYSGTKGFDDEWLRGENVYLARSRGCLTRRCVQPAISQV